MFCRKFNHKRSQDFFWGVNFLLQKSWRPFLDVVLKAQAKTSKIITPTVHTSPISQFPQKLDYCSAWGAHFAWVCTYNFPLEIWPPSFFLRPGGARAPSAPPVYAYEFNRLSSSGRILRIGKDFKKLSSQGGGAFFWDTV